jgi:arylsulfatase
MAVYAAMVDRLDQNIGRMIEKIEAMGEEDNTVIIFLADNGGCHEQIKNRGNYLLTTAETGTPASFDSYEYPWANASNTPFRMFKHWVHEGGISTPFIAYFPGKIKSGEIISQPGHIIDIMPTLLDFAGGKYPQKMNGEKIQPMEGISLIPAMNGAKAVRENPIFWEHEGNRAMRSGDWKLVSAYDYSERKFNAWELYDMKNDRSELNDLSSSFPEKTVQMIEEYNKWAERVGMISKEVLDENK